MWLWQPHGSNRVVVTVTRLAGQARLSHRSRQPRRSLQPRRCRSTRAHARRPRPLYYSAAGNRTTQPAATTRRDRPDQPAACNHRRKPTLSSQHYHLMGFVRQCLTCKVLCVICKVKSGCVTLTASLRSGGQATGGREPVRV